MNPLETKSRPYLFFLFLMVIFSQVNCQPIFAQSTDLIQEKHNAIIRQFVASVWAEYRTKVDQLGSNFITRVNHRSISFETENPGEVCPSSQEKEVAKIEFSNEKIGLTKEFSKLMYYGCDKKLILTENLRREGQGIKFIGINKILNGERHVELKGSDESVIWTLKDGSGLEFLRIYTKKIPDGLMSEIFFLGKQAIWFKTHEFNRVPRVQARSVLQFSSIDSREYSFAGQRPQNQWAYSFGGRYQLIQHIVDNDFSRYFVFHGNQQDIPQASYNADFSQVFQASLSNTAGEVLKLLATYLPKTEAGGAVSASSKRFVDELQLYIQRLRSAGTQDVTFVENELLRLLESIEKGEFIPQDNRPEP